MMAGSMQVNIISLNDACMLIDSYADVLPDMASGYMLFPKAWFCLPEVRSMSLHACQSLHHATYGVNHAMTDLCHITSCRSASS